MQREGGCALSARKRRSPSVGITNTSGTHSLGAQWNLMTDSKQRKETYQKKSHTENVIEEIDQKGKTPEFDKILSTKRSRLGMGGHSAGQKRLHAGSQLLAGLDPSTPGMECPWPRETLMRRYSVSLRIEKYGHGDGGGN